MINSPVTAIVLVILGCPLIQVQVACEGLVVFQPPGWLRGRAGWVQGVMRSRGYDDKKQREGNDAGSSIKDVEDDGRGEADTTRSFACGSG